MRTFYGIYRAVVVNAADPLRSRRVQIQVPDVLGAGVAWAFPACLSARVPSRRLGRAYGSCSRPEIPQGQSGWAFFCTVRPEVQAAPAALVRCRRRALQ
jgi:hypothetical protein